MFPGRSIIPAKSSVCVIVYHRVLSDIITAFPPYPAARRRLRAHSEKINLKSSGLFSLQRIQRRLTQVRRRLFTSAESEAAAAKMSSYRAEVSTWNTCSVRSWRSQSAVFPACCCSHTQTSEGRIKREKQLRPIDRPAPLKN